MAASGEGNAEQEPEPLPGSFPASGSLGQDGMNLEAMGETVLYKRGTKGTKELNSVDLTNGETRILDVSHIPACLKTLNVFLQ